ncbi:MAG: ribosome biogenesis GTPase Der [Armatimonadetes bacterium]|nr:ribosome biogenesis GTPase Der [Armatimonadota bacterium]
MVKPVVAIVGRPNVGKSTLFNRIVGSRIAVVENTPGITRDRIYADAEWTGVPFTLIDTGGILTDDPDPLKVQVRVQAEAAMEEADVILFVVDTIEGLTPMDRDVADFLRRSQKPVLVVANKVENRRVEDNAAEFYSLGFKDLHTTSSIHGHGVADLLDAIVALLPEPGPEEEEEDVIKAAIIGRPNVGKSSLLNAILGEDRAVVSDIPGTTRDAVDTPFEHEGQKIVLIDTAGIRRAGKVQGSVEYYTVIRAVQAIERCDVALLVIDASAGLLDGDKRIGGFAHEAGKACVLVINKWDAVASQFETESESNSYKAKYIADVRQPIPFLDYAPAVFTSSTEKYHIRRVLNLALEVTANYRRQVPTVEVSQAIHDAVSAHPLKSKGKQMRFYHATMSRAAPPTVTLYVDDPGLMHFSYERYLANRLREAFDFRGTPLRFQLRKGRGMRDPAYRDAPQKSGPSRRKDAPDAEESDRPSENNG